MKLISVCPVIRLVVMSTTVTTKGQRNDKLVLNPDKPGRGALTLNAVPCSFYCRIENEDFSYSVEK